MKHVSPATTIFLNNTILLLSSVSMLTLPLSYKWACRNFNNKHNLGLRVG